ncbi:MAG: hypothetical protein OXE50_01005, partial [Chloroflexi bacterium]|nr:hypothetical protein [Chloroflexota bacterium]
TGEWGLATLEVVLGIIQSGAEGREIQMQHQVPVHERYGEARNFSPVWKMGLSSTTASYSSSSSARR